MTSAPFTPASYPARRTMIAATGAVGLSAALTACGMSDDDSSASDTSTTASASTGSAAGDTSGSALTTTAEIPEGGGKIFASEKVVVTQPTAGAYKAFSSVCTHMGCAVKTIADGLINCPCHNSNFSIEDGSVKSGLATQPLPEVQITVSGDSITLA